MHDGDPRGGALKNYSGFKMEKRTSQLASATTSSAAPSVDPSIALATMDVSVFDFSVGGIIITPLSAGASEISSSMVPVMRATETPAPLVSVAEVPLSEGPVPSSVGVTQVVSIVPTLMFADVLDSIPEETAPISQCCTCSCRCRIFGWCLRGELPSSAPAVPIAVEHPREVTTREVDAQGHLVPP